MVRSTLEECRKIVAYDASQQIDEGLTRVRLQFYATVLFKSCRYTSRTVNRHITANFSVLLV